MESPSPALLGPGPTDPLGREICLLASHLNAAMADLCRLAASLEEQAAWAQDGIRSPSHWLSINAGLDLHSGSELLRVGRALRDLPYISQAFSSGQLSFDKVRLLTRVATSADDALWAELAGQVSASQLARICREVRRAIEANGSNQADAQLARRGLWAHFEEDGMLRLAALLPPEDGAAVLAALESLSNTHKPSDQDVSDPAQDSWAARRADALVTVFEHALTTPLGELTTTPSASQVVVHVDVGVLSGEQPEGLCQLEAGPAISAEVARRLGCDAQLLTITERDGLPVDVGREKRVVSTRLRRALQVRDRGCRFPGCGVPAQRTHAHHLHHWASGGATELSNLISLCHFHHRRLHDGAYRIRREPGGLHFETNGGHPIGLPPLAPVDPVTGGSSHLRQRSVEAKREMTFDTPVAQEGGAKLDFIYVTDVIAEACIAAQNPKARSP
jgi:hypothetical protein